MILFVANYPEGVDEKDGMAQRVAAMDRYFAGRERTYLAIRFFGNLRPATEHRPDRLVIRRLNFFLHFPAILALGFRARGIYVHSIHNGFRALPLYLFANVFTDLHGVFPEELAYYGKRVAALVYGLVERIVVRRSRAIIVVTDAMAGHYLDKYGPLPCRVFTIPIFDDFPMGGERERGGGDGVTVIYSGGMQRWQNVDLMLDAVARTPRRVEFVVLTPHVDPFRRKLAEYRLDERTRVMSVDKGEVYGHYLAADLGFVLRDDSVVNRAACPTKLVEYLASGVIPVVLQPRIGDFHALGYSWIGLERFVGGDIPAAGELEEMRVNNYRTIGTIRDLAHGAALRMVAELEDHAHGRTGAA